MDAIVNVFYHATSIIVGLWMLSASIAIFLKKEFIHSAILRLGYPQYFVYILGTAKLLGALFLLAPFPGLFKLLAFSGAAIELLCAAISYYVIDRKFSEWVKPLALLAIVCAAYLLWRLHDGLPVLSV